MKPKNGSLGHFLTHQGVSYIGKGGGCIFVIMTWIGVLNASDLTVDSATTLSETTTYDNAVIHADLSVKGGASISLMGNTFAIGPDVGDNPTITISEQSSLFDQRLMAGGNAGNGTHWLSSGAVIGANGGSAKFVVTNSLGNSHTASPLSTQLGLWLGGLEISENAAVNNAEDGTIDILEIQDGGWADIAIVTNKNDHPARILFNGGSMRKHYAGVGGGAPFYIPQGKEIILQSVNGNDIYLHKVYYGPRMLNGGGTLRTAGSGDVVIYETGFTEGSNKSYMWMPEASYGTVEWGHGGDLRLEWGGILGLRSSDTLPYGPGTGILRINGVNNVIYPEFNPNGYSAKLNGLVTTGAAYVSNRVATVSNLRFGYGDTDGVLSARIFGKVAVEKYGTGTLVVSNNTEVSVFNAVEGTVRVIADCTLGDVNVSDDATLVVDGAFARMSSLVASAGRVSAINGGNIILANGNSVTNFMWSEAFSAGGSIVKDGEGTLILATTQAVDSAIHVAQGNLVLSAQRGETNKWWRFWIKAPFGINSAFYMCEFVMLNTTAETCSLTDRIDAGIAYAGAQGVEAPLLQPGTVTLPSWCKWQEGGSGHVGGNPGCMFDGNTLNILMVTNANFYRADMDADPSKWVPLTFRLAESASAAGGYSIKTTQNGRYYSPYGWILESSPDGVTWKRMDEYTKFVPPENPREGETIYNMWYNDGVPFRFRYGVMPGAPGFAASNPVRVDAGATFDTSNVAGDCEFASLIVDAENGGGTITRFVPAANGSINLVSEGAFVLTSGTSLPFVLESTDGMANLRSWRVCVNGVLRKGWHVRYADGAFRFMPPGIKISFR